LKAHELGLRAATIQTISSGSFATKHHDDETSDPELDTPTYHPTHSPSLPKVVAEPTESPSSQPSASLPAGPSSRAEMVGFVSFFFFFVLLSVLYHYYIRKVSASSEEGIDMTNIADGRVDTNTAYGSTYYKVKVSDNA